MGLNYSDPYDQFYYQNCCGMPYERTEAWLAFFSGIADRIVKHIGPRSALDAGCAMGFLVECLRQRGVDAYGIDISAYAIGQVREDLRPYCRLGSVLDPLPRRYDLIVCIEVLEHLSPNECERAAANFCAASDDILFSSTPDDIDTATHVNVQSPEYWAALFARHGFRRDIDFDATFVTGWAMRFRRGVEPVDRLIESYERHLWAARRVETASRERLSNQEQSIEALQARLCESEDRARRLDETLRGIRAGLGWRIIERIGPLHQRLFPPGSRRGAAWQRLARDGRRMKDEG